MATTVDFILKPSLDKSAMAGIISEVQTSTSTIKFTPVTDKSGFDGIKKEADNIGKESADKFGNSFKAGFKNVTSGLDSIAKTALNPILAVFGGNMLTKGITSITGGFGDWIEKGKGVLATSNAMSMAFAQTGKSGAELDLAISSTNKVAGQLANQFALTVGDVREYSKAAAVLGGATGRSNEDLTKLGIAVEKSTNGLVSGTMAIRLFSKGVSDPESEFALARLTKQYPALGASLKGLKEPAEVTAKALSFFAPTFKEMEKQAGGALGSFTIMQNSLNQVKTAFGSLIIEAIAPFASAFAKTIVPAIQSFVSGIKGFAGLLKPLAPAFIAVGTAAGTMVLALLAMQGINYASGLITQGLEFSQTILTKVLPSIFAQTSAEGALLFTTENLTFAKIADLVVSKAKLALDFVQSTTVWQLVTGQLALNSAMLANPVGFVIAGIGLLVGAFYLLYQNVESVRNVFDTAWKVISFGAGLAWNVIKSIGSVLYEVGGLVLDVFISPFKIAWGVISAIGSAIGDLFGGVSMFGTDLSGVFTSMMGFANQVMGVFDTLGAVITGITSTIGSVTDSIATGLGQLVTLDFSGLIDTVSNAGDNASKAFSDTFNAKMRTNNFDEAKRNIELGLSQGGDIQAKVKAQVDFTETIKAYETVQQQIVALTDKKKNNLISPEESFELNRLTIKANEYGATIQKIAPESVKSFSAVVDANGEITNSYDINIAKANEFAKSNDFTSSLEAQKKSVSDNVSKMASTYNQQTDAVKKLQTELAKPVTDEKAYDKLKTSFKDAQKQADEMRIALVDNFYKAGQSGMLTETAISNVAKGLKITNAQAKDMLLAKELTKAGESGVLTATQIDKLSVKYNVSKDQVIAIFNKQKQITAETLKTTQATEDWSGALDRVKKDQTKALDAVKTAQLQYRKGLISKEDLDTITKASEEKIKAGNTEIKVFNDVGKEIAKNKNLRIDELETAKESAKEATKQTKESKSQYEILKERLQLEAEDLQASKDKNELKRESARLEMGITTSAKQANLDKLKDLQSEQNILELRKTNTKLLIESSAKQIKDKEKLSAESIRLNSELEKIDNAMLKVGNESIKIRASINISDQEIKREIDKTNAESKKKSLEFKIKIGEIPASELTKFELSNRLIDQQQITDDLEKIKADFAKNFILGLDNSENFKQIAIYKQKLIDAGIAVNDATKADNDQKEKERIDGITNNSERLRDQSIADAKKVYETDLLLAQDNISKRIIAERKYNDARDKANMKYQIDNSIALNFLTKLSDNFKNIKVSPIDTSKILDAKKTQDSIQAQKDALNKSFSDGKIDYEKYQTDLTDLQARESDARIALEQAEADKRKAVWAGVRSAFGETFGAMAIEYKEKFVNSMTDADATLSDVFENLAVYSSSIFAQMIADNDNFGKSLLKTSLAVLKALVPIFVVQIMGGELSKLGIAGLITGTALTATLYGLLALAESAVGGAFKDGVIGYNGKGSGTSDSNLVKISNGESIITTKATNKNKALLEHINKGGSLESFIANNSGLKSMIVDKELAKYYSDVELQKIQLNALMLEKEKTNSLINELRSERKVLIEKLDNIDKTLKTTKLIESHHAFNVVATNNITKEVSQMNYWNR